MLGIADEVDLKEEVSDIKKKLIIIEKSFKTSTTASFSDVVKSSPAHNKNSLTPLGHKTAIGLVPRVPLSTKRGVPANLSTHRSSVPSTGKKSDNRNTTRMSNVEAAHAAPVSRNTSPARGTQEWRQVFRSPKKSSARHRAHAGPRKSNVAPKFKTNFRAYDMFVSNCSASTTPNKIGNYISDLYNINILNIDELSTRNKNFKSFKVTVKSEDRDYLLDNKLWPHDVFVRKYYTKKPSVKNRYLNMSMDENHPFYWY